MASIVSRNLKPFNLEDVFPVGRKVFGNFCVYLHHRLDGSIFYIGKGLRERPFSKKRTPEWLEEARNGYSVTILFDNMDNYLAEAVEKLLISIVGIDNITNKTLGGGGALGYKHSDAHRARMSDAMRGSGNPMFGRVPHNLGVPCPDCHKDKMRKPRPSMAGDLNGASDDKIWEFVNKAGERHTGTRCSLQKKYGLSPRDTTKICVSGRKSAKGWSIYNGES